MVFSDKDCIIENGLVDITPETVLHDLDLLSNTYAGRFCLFALLSGTLALRASCFTSRLCLRCPLEGRLGLVLAIGAFIRSAPCILSIEIGFLENSVFLLTSADTTPPHR